MNAVSLLLSFRQPSGFRETFYGVSASSSVAKIDQKSRTKSFKRFHFFTDADDEKSRYVALEKNASH